MNVISSSFKAPGVWLPGLKPRFWCSYVTSGQTAVQKELCSMSHEKRGLPCPALQFCLAGLLVPCPGQAAPQQCWHLSTCVVVPTPADTRPTLLTMSRWGDCGDRVWPSCLHPWLPHCHPQLLADLDLWSSLPLIELGGILLCPQLPDAGGLSLTLIASLRNHLSNLCGLFLLA